MDPGDIKEIMAFPVLRMSSIEFERLTHLAQGARRLIHLRGLRDGRSQREALGQSGYAIL